MRLKRLKSPAKIAFLCILTFMFSSCSSKTAIQKPSEQTLQPVRSVKGMMQARPGGPLEMVEVGVHEVPIDLPIVKVDQAKLNDNDLVLGVVKNGKAVAFPIRFLAMYEVVDSKVGKLPVAPTW